MSDIANFTWADKAQNKFNVGNQVWVVYDKKPAVSYVHKVCLELKPFGGSGEQKLHCVGYGLSHDNDADDHMDPEDQRPQKEFYPHEIYTDKETATQMAEWHEVTGILDEDWTDAIGARGVINSAEQSSFGGFYGVDSQVYSLLARCRHHRGLTEAELRRLSLALEQSEKPLIEFDLFRNYGVIFGLRTVDATV